MNTNNNNSQSTTESKSSDVSLENKIESKKSTNSDSVKIVIISDTHGHHSKLDIPEADLLIHCGDFTNYSNIAHLVSFNKWLSTLPIKHKPVIVVGNHESMLNFEMKLKRKINWETDVCNAHVLNNESIILDGIKIHGIGWKPQSYAQLSWFGIPSDVDIIITHNPPLNILAANEGCEVLWKTIEMKRPAIHCFGHIHSHRGIKKSEKSNVLYINAANVDKFRKPVHPPIVLNMTRKKIQSNSKKKKGKNTIEKGDQRFDIEILQF